MNGNPAILEVGESGIRLATPATLKNNQPSAKRNAQIWTDHWRLLKAAGHQPSRMKGKPYRSSPRDQVTSRPGSDVGSDDLIFNPRVTEWLMGWHA